MLIGIQQGAVVPPGSGAAIGINSALLGVKVLFATYLGCIRPHVLLSACVTEAACAWLEVSVCACILLLQVTKSP